MGQYTYSIPVKYAAPLQFPKPLPMMGTGPTIDDAADSVCSREGLRRNDVDVEVWDYPYEGVFGLGKKEARVAVLKRPPFHHFTLRATINGWKHEDEGVELKRGRHSVYANKFTKGTKIVYVINESPYECVGEIEFTAFGDDKEALQEFLNDFGVKATIIADTTVQQTI